MAASNSGPSKRGKNKNKPPAKPPRPPAGSYDPILNSQARAADRGLGDLTRDTETQRERGLEDYNSNLGALTTGRDRTLADILTGETRATQDRDTALGNLDLQYDRLATRQAEGARVSGVTSQGLLNKSAAVRDANETRDQQPILTNFGRAIEDFGTARGRTTEDFGTRSELLSRDYGRTFDPLAGDLTKQLRRAGRENTFFQQDINEQKAYQAAQTGWQAPKQKKPKNFKATPSGAIGLKTRSAMRRLAGL
jgi:hypothetical protein